MRGARSTFARAARGAALCALAASPRRGWAEQIPPPAPVGGALFGQAAVGLNDLTGDGAPELLIGAPLDARPAAPSHSGAAYLYQAGLGLPVRTITSPNPLADGNFGTCLAGVADLTGDGKQDLAIGAPNEKPPASGTASGTVHLFSGAEGAFIRTLSSPNPIAGGRFGASAAAVPDVNGDGSGDILVGAPQETAGGSLLEAGRAYLFSGAGGVLLRSFTAPAPQALAHFGSAAAAVPDLTGDGVPDLLIAAQDEDLPSGKTDAGRAYVFNGATGALVWTLQSPSAQAGGYFGCAAAGSPDLNLDGRGDLVLGAYGESSGANALAGRAYVFSGSTGALLRTLISPLDQAIGLFGFAVASTPDATGDSRPDILVGAESETQAPGPTRAGRAHLFNGATGALVRTFASPNEEPSGAFGDAVAAVADLNGDGRPEILIGAPKEDPGSNPADSGMAYVFDGATGAVLVPTPSPTPSLTVTPTPTLTVTPTPTLTVTPTPTTTKTPTPAPSPSSASTSTPTPTRTPTASASATASPAPSASPTSGATATPTAGPSPSPPPSDPGSAADPEWNLYD